MRPAWRDSWSPIADSGRSTRCPRNEALEICCPQFDVQIITSKARTRLHVLASEMVTAKHPPESIKRYAPTPVLIGYAGCAMQQGIACCTHNCVQFNFCKGEVRTEKNLTLAHAGAVLHQGPRELPAYLAGCTD